MKEPEYYDGFILNPDGPRTPDKEHVLVFPSSLVHLGGGFEQSPLMTSQEDIAAYLHEIMQPDSLYYIDRDHAEQDEQFLQLIPYVVVWRGREVFRYQRSVKGGDSRLHGLHSIGVGGHINPVDGDDGEPTDQAYWNALRRELKEEIDVTLPDNLAEACPVVGLIFDPSNAVGRVHLGVVHMLRLPGSATISLKDPALAGGYFQHCVDLKQSTDEFETWSRLAIDKLI